MGAEIHGTPESVAESIKEVKTEAKEEKARLTNELLDEIREDLEDGHPDTIKKQKKDKKELKKHHPRKIKGAKEKKDVEKESETKDSSKKEKEADVAKKIGDEHPEFKSKAEELENLRDELAINEDDKAEAILEKIKGKYKDAYHRDVAFNFLQQTTEGDLQREVSKARERNADESSIAVAAGNNTTGVVRTGKEKEDRTDYTTIVEDHQKLRDNPEEELVVVFEEIYKENPSYLEMQEKIAALEKCAAAEARSEHPSLDEKKLPNLVHEIKRLQDVNHLYKFFQNREKLIHKLIQGKGN